MSYMVQNQPDSLTTQGRIRNTWTDKNEYDRKWLMWFKCGSKLFKYGSMFVQIWFKIDPRLIKHNTEGT